MIKVLDIILDIICIIGVVFCAVGLVLYIAAVIAVANANDIWDKINEWLHRG